MNSLTRTSMPHCLEHLSQGIRVYRLSAIRNSVLECVKYISFLSFFQLKNINLINVHYTHTTLLRKIYKRFLLEIREW